MTSITGLTISGSEIKINYTNVARGLLSEAAYKAAGKPLKASGTDAFRSVGYFGIGFGGNMKSNGKKSQGFALNEMDLTRYTHINVAFLAINSKGNLTIPNSFSSQGSTVTNNQPQWLQDVNNKYKNDYPDDTKYSNNTYVYTIFEEIHRQTITRSNHDVKIMACIGGWNVANNTDSKLTPAVTQGYGDILHELAKGIETNKSDPDNFIMYKSFKTDLQYLKNKGWIDGVDIDWEYPGRPPIASLCKGKDGVERPCKVSQPTKIGPCNSLDPVNCSSFSYDNNQKIDNCGDESYRLPKSTPDKMTLPGLYSEPTYYSAFIKAIKDDILIPEISIALAGAPWGLHWYANTATTLLKSGHIDFANIMAYDYNGFWGSGQVSGFLSNMTNINILKICNQNTPPCNSVSKCDECFNTGCASCEIPCVATTKSCGSNQSGGEAACNWGPNYPCIKNVPDCAKVVTPKAWDNCTKSTNITFTNSQTNSLDIINEPPTCPLILYNQFGAYSNTSTDVKQDVTEEQRLSFWISIKGNWFDDINKPVPASIVNSEWTPRITLSLLTMLNILTNVFGIPKNQLVLGLPYYGRTFQTKSSGSRSFKEGSYGLYQPYEYGTAYSYSDIHQTYYKAGNKKEVYTIMLDKGDRSNPQYTEDIVYTKSLLHKITPEMTEEMISYNSEESIKTKVKYAATEGYGGYMCWHMLSDYYA